jgi:hypothetical protein
LTATEVASEAAAAPLPEPHVEQTPASPAAEPDAAARPAGEAAAASPPPPEAPQDSSEPPRAEPPPGSGSPPPEFPWTAAAAGAVAAAGVLLVVLVIWLVVPRDRDPVAALTPRLAAIETQLRDLSARPVPPGVEPRAIEVLSARLAKLENAVSAPRTAANDPALASRVTSLEGVIKPLSESVAALAKRADEADAALRASRGRADASAAGIAELQDAARASSADHGEIAKLASRVAELEKRNQTMAEELAKRAATGSDRPVRLAVAASALRAALERGDPFAAELAAVKPLVSDPGALGVMDSFAASGVPGAAALGRELLLLLPVMQRAAGAAPRDGGILDRLQANAERLVRIRPVEEVPGEDVAAILSRIEVKAAHADIDGTLAELAKLPPPVRAPAFDWIAKAETRNKAIAASRRLAADAMTALKTTQ